MDSRLRWSLIAGAVALIAGLAVFAMREWRRYWELGFLAWLLDDDWRLFRTIDDVRRLGLKQTGPRL